jgi:hypothetical protein
LSRSIKQTRGEAITKASRWNFKLCDVRRAVTAVTDVGLPISDVKIDPDGTIHVITAPLDKLEAASMPLGLGDPKPAV